MLSLPGYKSGAPCAIKEILHVPMLCEETAGCERLFFGISLHGFAPLEACSESNAKRKSYLTFAFLSPKVTMEKIRKREARTWL